MKSLLKIALMVNLFTLGACAEKRETSVDPQSGLQPIATIQDIMQSLVDPAADSLWDAVSTTVTAAGTEEKQPHSDEEWTVLRRHAITLVEAANLLAIPGRKVALHGKTLEDAHVEGINTPEAIEALISADRAPFVGYATRLQEASGAVLIAIDKRDVPALIEAGGKLDQACEQCHLHYWYPHAAQPPEL